MNKDSATSAIRGRIRLSFWIFLGVLATGTGGYWLISDGKASLLDCFYMTVITVSTVGYGEVISITPFWYAKLFTIALIFAGMSVILYFISNVTAFLIEGNLKELFWRKKMQKLIGKLNGHYIVCGAGKFGEHIIREFVDTRRPFVVIEAEREHVTEVAVRFPDAPVVHGDAAENDVLEAAGVGRAAGMLVATENDKDNIVITLTGRQMNHTMRIVTRCNDARHSEKLKRAGADSVVSTNFIAGLRMASEMFRPSVVSFLDKMLRDKERNLRIEEMVVPEGAGLGTMQEARRYALVLAIRYPDGSYQFNPSGETVLAPGATLIFMGSPDDRGSLSKALLGGAA